MIRKIVVVSPVPWGTPVFILWRPTLEVDASFLLERCLDSKSSFTGPQKTLSKNVRSDEFVSFKKYE